MKRVMFLGIIALSLFTIAASAQTTSDSSAAQVVPDKRPEFKGGINRWIRFLEQSLDRNLLSRSKAPAGKYTTVVSFLVDTDGSVKDIRAENDPGYGAAEEAKRVIGLSSKKWSPAMLNNVPVAIRIRQSLTLLSQ